MIASIEAGDHFIVVDDDMLLFPRQVARLVRHLLDHPEVPHGLAGLRAGRYHQRAEMEVDNLNQVYAVTRAHLATYVEYCGG